MIMIMAVVMSFVLFHPLLGLLVRIGIAVGITLRRTLTHCLGLVVNAAALGRLLAHVLVVDDISAPGDTPAGRRLTQAQSGGAAGTSSSFVFNHMSCGCCRYR